MNNFTSPPPFLLDLFPHAGPELLRLLAAAVENAALLHNDFFTIRDWIELTGTHECESLHVLLLALLLALEEGSFCIELSEASLVRRLADLGDEEAATTWAGRIMADLDSRCFAALIGGVPGDHKPIILHRVEGQPYLYFQKYLRAELQFHDALRRCLKVTTPCQEPAGLAPIVREVLVEQPLRGVDGEPVRLDREQQWALGMALLRNVAIISGGPGTGKTSIVLTLLRCLVRCGHKPERIALAAPTGRAAQRLSDALRAGLQRLPGDNPTDALLHGLAASTLHQLLGYRPNRNLFSRHIENPIPADVVVIDEGSMIGLVLMAQLFQALAPGTKLILLGDKDQLPSVDAGAVLANLVPEGRTTAFSSALCTQLQQLDAAGCWPTAPTAGALADHVVVLQTNHRSQPEIRAAADAINRQDAAIVDTLPSLHFPEAASAPTWWDDLETRGGCWLLEQTVGSASELRGFLQHWAEQAVCRSGHAGSTLAELVAALTHAKNLDGPEAQDMLPRLFGLLDRYRLLTLVREGPWGCDDVNRYLDGYLRPKLDADARGGLFAGAPVLITRNDAPHGLFNGDVGLALRLSDGNLRVVFPRQGSFVAFPAEALPAHEFGFALTVHKSQGSEYANVMVVLPPEGGRRLLTKELVYTAVTRAKSLAVLCGTKAVLRLAVARKITRESGLMQTFG